MSAISQLKQASHFGITFPYTRCEASIQVRKHEHVYLHTSGGEVEKLGLALRKWTFTIPAHDTLQPPFRNFYSQGLPQLWAKWESMATGPLVVPSVGTVQAMVEHARRVIERMTSGEAVEVSFLEDSRTLATLAAVFKPTADVLPTMLRAAVTPLRAAPSVPQSTLDRLERAVQDAITLASGGSVQARVWEARISQVINLCETVRALPVLANPVNFPALDLVLDLYHTAITLREDAQRRGRPALLWATPTPARLSVQQVAAWIYRDTSRAPELLALNEWDPLNIPAGSVVRYYA